MTTTKQSWLKRSLAVLLAVMMVMSMGVADVFAVEPSGTMLTDGTYKVPFSFNYYMAGQMYEMAAGKPNALIQTPATIEVKDGKMTVTLSAVKDGTDYVTKFQYRLQDDENYTEAAVSDTDKDGNVDQISFTIDYTEDYLVTTVHYTSSVEAGFESALCFDFSKAEMEGGDQPPVEGDTEATHTIKLKVDSAKAAEIIKIPDDDGSIMTSNGGIDNAISAYVQPTLSLSAYELSMMAGDEETVTATLKGADGYAVTKWESSNSSVAAVDNGKITAKGEGTATITVTATKSGEADLTKTISVTVAPAGSEAVKAETTVNGSAETITVSGDFLTSGGSDNVEVSGDTVTIDAASAASGITSSKVIIPQKTAEALMGKTVVVKTSAGSVTLDSALIAQISKVNGGATLSISEASVPVGLGTFSSAYELTLEDKNGDTVEFGEGKATVTVTSEDAVSYAYCIANGQRTERVAVSTSGDQVSFTVSHFSLWALSDREYETGGEAGTGFFLEDGNYYVDIDLWKSDSNEASMGNVAFKNNGKALITVKNGKITRVQIGTNPVDIDPYHSAIIKFELADGTAVSIDATGELTTVPANKNYTYIKLVSFNLPDSAQPDISDAITYVPVNFYVPDTPMDAAVGETLTARLRFTWSTATKTDDTSLKVDDTSAAGDSDITGEEIVDVNLTDEATGIKLETNSGILSDKAVLSVSKLTQGADYDIALKAMNGVEGSWSLYKITTLVEGVETAPLGSVLLYIPCGEDGLTLYRVNADGSKTLVKGEVQNGYYVVRTTSLGLFAMVGEVTGGGNSGQNQNGDTTIPQTGDSTNVLPFALLALASGGMIGVLFISRKRKTVK